MCELACAWESPQGANTRIDELWAWNANASGGPRRVYLGSSFCPQMLLALTPAHVSNIAGACSERGISITLALPIATERNLDAVNEHVLRLIEASSGTIDELTVNDLGAFSHWGAAVESGLPVVLNIGRLMNKDPRDPRDPVYQHLTHVPQLLESSWRGDSMIDRLAATYPVRGIELDVTNDVIDLSALPYDVEAAVHGPCCYMSTAQICEFASIGVAQGEKFRPNSVCALQCQKNAILYCGASGVEFLKLGRTVYFDPAKPVGYGDVSDALDTPGETPLVVGAHNYRRVFAPLVEVLG